MPPPLELPQPLQDVALLLPSRLLLLGGGADVTGSGGTQTQPLLPGQGRLQDDRTTG